MHTLCQTERETHAHIHTPTHTFAYTYTVTYTHTHLYYISGGTLVVQLIAGRTKRHHPVFSQREGVCAHSLLCYVCTRSVYQYLCISMCVASICSMQCAPAVVCTNSVCNPVCVCVLQVIISGAVSVGRCAVNTYCPGPAPCRWLYLSFQGWRFLFLTPRLHICSWKHKRAAMFSHISINCSRLYHAFENRTL